MAQYLLGENTLIDLCYNDTSSQEWLNGVASTELYTSVIAVAAARETIGAIIGGAKARDRQLLNLQQILARLKADGMTILPFEQEHADEWANWRAERLAVSRNGIVGQAPQDTRMIIATATVRGLCLVEPLEDYHTALQAHGLKVVSL